MDQGTGKAEAEAPDASRIRAEPRATAGIGFRLNVAILCILGFFLLATSAAMLVLFEQYKGFKSLSGTYFDTAMAAAELTRDAEVVAAEVFESMLGVSRSAADDHRTDSNLLRIYEAVRSRLGSDFVGSSEGLAEADQWQQPYFQSIQTLRARMFDERLALAETARNADDLTRLIQAVRDRKAEPGADKAALDHGLGVLAYAATALVSEKLGQIDRLHTAASESLSALEMAQQSKAQPDPLIGEVLSVARAIFSGRDAALRAQQATLATARQTRVLAQKLSGGTFNYYLDLKEAARAAIARHQDLAQTALWTLAAFVVTSVAAIIYFLIYVRRRIVQRLNNLSTAMHHQVLGVPAAIPRDGGDEIADMAEAFQVFVSARTEAEQNLVTARNDAERASRAKSEFLANMSHEIRTPLNAIIGFGGLARQTADFDEKNAYLAKIGSSAQHLLTVIDDILDFSKIEAGKLVLENVSFDLSEVMDTVSDIVAGAADQKNLALHISVHPGVPRALIGDPLRLGQVLVNLAGNAVKFTQNGHVMIQVFTEETDDISAHLRFEVSDTGIGMSPHQLGRLFAEFHQADPSISRRFGGTGLGLAICKRLVDMMGGEITATSREGQGSTFTFSLEFALQAPENRREFAIPPDLRDLRILVAESDPLARRLMCGHLDSFGFQNSCASTGAEAVEELLRAAIDDPPHYGLVIMDHLIQKPSYADTVGRMLDEVPSNRWPELALILGIGDDNADEDRPGVAAIIKRPVRTSDLLNAILKAFGKNPAKEKYRRWSDSDLPDEVGRLAGARILLVDDQPYNLEIAEKLLGDQGVIVETCDNGRQAAEKALNFPSDHYAAVLMDVQMPEMDGYEATKRIRDRHSAAALPIIAMTAHAMAEQKNACLAAGMNDHIAKPINVRKLWETLLRWIGPFDAVNSPPALPKQPKTAVQLPLLPDFDLNGALKRMAGDSEFLLSLLRSFPRRALPLLDEAVQASTQDDAAGQERAAHTLAGMAASIGADSLCRAAKAVETALRNGDKSEAAALMPAMEREARKVCSQLQTSVPDEITPVAETGAAAAAPVDIDGLLSLLDNNDLDAVALWRKLAPGLHARLPGDSAAIAARMIEDLEFAQAARILREQARSS